MDGCRRGRGGFTSHYSSELDNERKVHLTRNADSIIVQVPNNLYQNPNVSSNNRRGYPNNRPQAPLKSNLKSSANGHISDGSR